MVKVVANLSFSGHGITASNGEELNITDEKVFLDLAAAGFVSQVDSKPSRTPRNNKEE